MDHQFKSCTLGYAMFQGQESAQPNCGGAAPDEFTTLIQYAPGQLPGTFLLWGDMQKGNDCIHPNEDGAEAYGNRVAEAALQLLKHSPPPPSTCPPTLSYHPLLTPADNAVIPQNVS